jgi:protein SCO1/2
LVGATVVFLWALPAPAQDELPPALRDVGIDQRLNEQVPLDLVFRDEAGQAVPLRTYFDGPPVILVLAYYKCPRLCNLVLGGLGKSLRGLSFTLGEQFRVVTVSFDPRETPLLAAAKKAAYLEQYGRPGAAAGWHFLTGDQAAIKQLAQAVGFRYTYDARLDQYAHASGIMVLTPQGKIARYFYGVDYPSRDLRLGLVEASANRIGSAVDQVLLFCYAYDAATGKYTAAVRNLVRLGGAVTVVAVGTFLVLMWRRERRGARQKVAPAG